MEWPKGKLTIRLILYNPPELVHVKELRKRRLALWLLPS
jgi:hypothetical protein